MRKYVLFFILSLWFSFPATAIDVGKQFYPENQTMRIYNSANGNTWATIQLVSVQPDIVTLIKEFNIIASINYTISDIDSFKYAFRSLKGAGITGQKWEILKTVSYQVDDYAVNSTWIPEHPDGNGSTIPGYWRNISYVSGNHSEYKQEWQLFRPVNGITLSKGKSYRLRQTLYRPAETGDTRIHTNVTFFGLVEDNFTWWNTSWAYAIHNRIADGSRPYQLRLNVSNGTGTNNATWVFVKCQAVNCSDLRFTLDNTTELPHWWETNASPNGIVWVNVTGSAPVNMYYGNSVASSMSNGTTTFTQYHGSTTSNFLDSLVVTQPFVYEASVIRTSSGGSDDLSWGVSDHATPRDGAGNYIINVLYVIQNQRYFQSYVNGTPYNIYDTPVYGTNVTKKIKIIVASNTSTTLKVDGYSDLTQSNVPVVKMGLVMQIVSGTGKQDYSFIRSYASPEPVWATWSAEESQSQPSEFVQVISI